MALAAVHKAFYRHFYRQSAEHQHWRGFPGGFAKTHLSRSIDVYRLPRPSPTPSTPDGVPTHNERHRPEQTTLHYRVQRRAASFIAIHTEASTGAKISQRLKARIRRLPRMRPCWRTAWTQA
jgi:hypothetical protein